MILNEYEICTMYTVQCSTLDSSTLECTHNSVIIVIIIFELFYIKITFAQGRMLII